MKKFKRIIALITVAMFLLSIAAPSAFAATKEEAFGRLNALGVAYGDDKGDPMYDKSFTRAEAAAIMVNLLGMKAAINSAKGATKFKDVPATHWASGVVNLAVGAGVIKGYPDGSYKPNKEVTYAEMSAMLVQVLGYAPKLQGTWPSNVIGKAAQLGLLDGVSVTDVNAAAVRSNVFLAADKATTVKPLKETKDGYEEDTKTLMEAKLTVTKKAEATVTATPAYSAALDKNKITVDYPAGAAVDYETLTTIDTINPDDYYGLKVEAWLKDDKVFFLNVKNDSADILVDTIEEMRDASGNKLVATTKIADTVGGAVYAIKLDSSDKVITVVPGTTAYKKNFADTSASNTIGYGASVKVILGSDGKAAKVLASSYSNGIVDSIDTTNEKITMDSETVTAGSTIELKDKKVKLYRNGAVAKLADLKKGDVLDFIDTGDVKIVYANDKTATGKLTSVLDDGKSKDESYNKFIFKVGDKDYKSTKFVFYSTNNGDTYTKTTGDTNVLTSAFNSLLNKDLTVKLDKSGKAAYLIAGSAADSSDIPVLVKYIKRVATTETKRYIYVTKFDGTNTYYEVTKDTKINGIKINEDALKELNAYAIGVAAGPRVLTTTPAAEIVVGDVVKLNLNADNTVNEIKTYGSDLQTAGSYAVSKDNDTFMVTGGTNLIVDTNTKLVKVKTAVTNNVASDGIADAIGATYYDDVESVTWASAETLSGAELNKAAAVVKDGGKAKYIVFKDPTTAVATSDYFGVVVGLGTNGSGDSFLTLGYDGKVEDKVGSIPGSPARKNVVKFKLKPDGKIDTGAVLNAEAVYSTYVDYKVDSISDRQVKLIPASATYVDVAGAPAQYIIVDLAKVKVWDVDVNTTTPVTMTLNDIIGKYVQVYDEFNTDGVAIADGVYDFIMVVKK